MTYARALIAIFVLALVLRLIAGLTADPSSPYIQAGGDSWWFLGNGRALVTGEVPLGMSVDLASLQTPPAYLVFVGAAQAILPAGAAVVLIRIVQAILGTVVCAFAYGIAFRLTGRVQAGMAAAFLIAISPAFVLESAQILSEPLYLFFVAAGLAAYVEFTVRTSPEDPRRRTLIVAGICFGMAALTRAPILLFPVGLAIHLLLLMVGRHRSDWRRALGYVALLLLVYAAVVSTWTIYGAARWGRLVIGGQGFAAFVYIGATGWESPESVDARIGSEEGGAADTVFMEAAAASISADPLGYVGRRLGELAAAGLQPHGTTYFPGASLRDAAVLWAREDRTVEGLLQVVRGDAFVPKLLLYVFHYGVLIGGVIGVWRARRQWRLALILIGFIVYTLLVHLILLALPRYLFPTLLAWSILAAAALFPPVWGASLPMPPSRADDA